ncbi:MAG: hypothetical protein FD126_2641, partial [Elusimicrobia bacterium]
MTSKTSFRLLPRSVARPCGAAFPARGMLMPIVALALPALLFLWE